MVSGFPELTYKEQENKQLDLGPTASSLDLLQAVYRDPTQQLTTRIRCAMAKATAPLACPRRSTLRCRRSS